MAAVSLAGNELIPDSGISGVPLLQFPEDAAPVSVVDLLRGAAGVLGADHFALPGDGVGYLRIPAAALDGTLHDEVPNDETK